MKTSASKRIFISDCEGPISKNDNAFELASFFVPNGNRLFTLISKYDDVLADVVKRPGYRAGDTLKLILPFLRAYGATNQTVTDYCSRNVMLVPAAREMLYSVKAFMPTFIVSTSYEQYMRALSHSIGFAFKNVRCTKLDLDNFEVNENEAKQVDKLRKEMVKMPIPEIPSGAKSLSSFPQSHQNVVKRLDVIFWKELFQMRVGALLREVNPMGGAEKAEAVQSITNQLNSDLSNVMYVGDSITDVSAFRLVRQGGGLTISFNGNHFAVREAEVTVLSESASVTALLAYVFNLFGKSHAMNLASKWSRSMIEEFLLGEPLKNNLLSLRGERFPRLELCTARNMKRLIKESTQFRRRVRGEAIAKLG